MNDEGNGWLVYGGVVLIALAVLGLWWFLPGKPLSGPGWQKESFFQVIPLRPGSGPAVSQEIARGSGFAVVTNAAFNDLIPVENREAAFSNCIVLRYVTPNTNDTRLLAVPMQGTNCYLFIWHLGDAKTVKKMEDEVKELTRKLQDPSAANHSMQRTGASRSALFAVAAQPRLAPAADAGR